MITAASRKENFPTSTNCTYPPQFLVCCSSSCFCLCNCCPRRLWPFMFFYLMVPGFKSRHSQKKISFFKTSTSTLRSTPSPIQLVPGFFLGGYSGLGVKLTTYLHLVPRLRINGVIHLLRLYAFMTLGETNLSLYWMAWRMIGVLVLNEGYTKFISRSVEIAFIAFVPITRSLHFATSGCLI